MEQSALHVEDLQVSAQVSYNILNMAGLRKPIKSPIKESQTPIINFQTFKIIP